MILKQSQLEGASASISEQPEGLKTEREKSKKNSIPQIKGPVQNLSAL